MCILCAPLVLVVAFDMHTNRELVGQNYLKIETRSHAYQQCLMSVFHVQLHVSSGSRFQILNSYMLLLKPPVLMYS